MSMLSLQVNELRIMADKLRRVNPRNGAGYVEAVETLYMSMGAMREAADTIENLQGEANHWKVEQVHAYSNWEDAHSRVKELEADNDTRWHQLFGTPERAARTLLDACDNCGQDECSGCQVYELTSGGDLDYDALLEWLRGEGE